MTLREFKILQWNIRSALSNYTDAIMIANQEKPDIIMLNETWLKNKDSLRIKNYQTIRQDRQDGKGGLAILSNNAISVNILDLQLHIDWRIQILGITCQGISIVTCYCPPDISLSITNLRNMFSQIPQPFVFMGDLNGQNSIWGSHINNQTGRNLAEIIDECNFTILNNGVPTRLTPPLSKG